MFCRLPCSRQDILVLSLLFVSRRVVAPAYFVVLYIGFGKNGMCEWRSQDAYFFPFLIIYARARGSKTYFLAIKKDYLSLPLSLDITLFTSFCCLMRFCKPLLNGFSKFLAFISSFKRDWGTLTRSSSTIIPTLQSLLL